MIHAQVQRLTSHHTVTTYWSLSTTTINARKAFVTLKKPQPKTKPFSEMLTPGGAVPLLGRGQVLLMSTVNVHCIHKNENKQVIKIFLRNQKDVRDGSGKQSTQTSMEPGTLCQPLMSLCMGGLESTVVLHEHGRPTLMKYTHSHWQQQSSSQSSTADYHAAKQNLLSVRRAAIGQPSWCLPSCII